MVLSILPDIYRNLDDTELSRRVAVAKARFGKELCILGHYYQRDDIVRFADHQGDSFTLAKAGSKTDAKWIVFCGVHFMAEASVMLAKSHQRVFLPDMDAGCPLSDMASIDQVEDAWNVLEKFEIAGEFLPITYMNSSALLKAFCGQRGGAVCTSSSAGRAFAWAFDQRKKIFFFPDENLGRNTAHAYGISPEDVVLWDPYAGSGGLGRDALMRARVIVWKGHCHVHTYFTVQQIQDARVKYPGCRVVVHPECVPDVVAAADGNGSTAYLKEFAEGAPLGSTVIIGTEINLVARLAREMPGKMIIPLARSLCPNMFKVSLADLCWTLDSLGEVNEVLVPDDIARNARIALERMLKFG